MTVFAFSSQGEDICSVFEPVTTYPVGNTPLVPILGSSSDHMRLFGKIEWCPSGRCDNLRSIKDRTAYFMIKDAEERGILGKSNRIVVEASSGNTGIALARICRFKGYDIEIVVSRKASRGTIDVLRSLGVKVLVPSLSPGSNVAGTDESVALARAMVNSNLERKMKGMREFFMPNQYENEANFLAHYKTTGPEIWHQTRGRVTHVFVGVGTGGTLSGVEQYLKEKNPAVKVYAVESEPGSKIQGIRNFDESEIPKLLARKIDVEEKKRRGEWLTVSDEEAFQAIRRLAVEDRIIAGLSSGATLAAALEISKQKRELGVVILADSGYKYRSLYRDLSPLTEREMNALDRLTVFDAQD